MAPVSLLFSSLQPLFFFLLLTSTILTTKTSSSPLPPPSPPPTSSSSNSTDFIKTRCQSTLYPSLCFSSLSRYAPSIQQNPVRLARTSAKLATSQIHSAASHVSSYLHTTAAASPRTAAALKDCVDTLGDAGDQTWQSASEIGKLDGGGGMVVGPEVAWRVSNAQTWMSAALTNEETCTDGMEGVEAEGRVKGDVANRVGRAKQYTSNSLALVNSLVNGR